ncbi:MAG: branched-chain amino acid ABC transporter permease [Desulfurococcaceae archaeon]
MQNITNAFNFFIRSRSFFVFTCIVLLMLILSTIFSRVEYIMHVIIITLWYMYLTTSWAIFCGQVGQVSLGHSTFVGIGAYGVVLLYKYYGIPPLIGMFISVLVATLMATGIGIPTFKYGVKGPYFIFATLALSQILYSLAVTYREYTGGELGITLPYIDESPLYLMFRSKLPYFYILLFLWIAVSILLYKLQRSRIGYYLYAIRDDEDAAEAIGISTFKYKLLMFITSAALTSIAGSLYAVYFLVVTPISVFGMQLSFNIATLSFIGGWRSWIGPSISPLFVVPLWEVTRVYFGATAAPIALLIYGVLLIILSLTMPYGISKYIFKGQDEVK